MRMSALPEKVRQAIELEWGEIKETGHMKGIKQDGGCYRVETRRGRLCAKPSTVQEICLYSYLNRQDSPIHPHIPHFFAGIEEAEGPWLLMEYLPLEYPRSRWQGDGEQMEVLAGLHGKTRGRPLQFHPGYTPLWSSTMKQALDQLFRDVEVTLPNELLRQFEERVQGLFQPVCWVHGDPNPTNWRMRRDGTLVLLDWERLTAAHPAVDLAITLPGTGSLDGRQEYELASIYWEHIHSELAFPLAGSKEDLGTQVWLAKLWSVAEYLIQVGEALPKEQAGQMAGQLAERLKNYFHRGE